VTVDTQPVCTANASLNDTVEADRVQLYCVVTHDVADKRISMTWKGVTDSSTAIKIGWL